MTEFEIESVNISEKKGIPKHEVPEITLVENHGIAGDAHAGAGHRQVSFLAGEAVDKMKALGLSLSPGAFGENIVTRGMDWTLSEIGERIAIGQALLEITKIGKECHSHCAIYEAAGDCIMPRHGIFARVLKGGSIRAQDRGHYGL